MIYYHQAGIGIWILKDFSKDSLVTPEVENIGEMQYDDCLSLLSIPMPVFHTSILG